MNEAGGPGGPGGPADRGHPAISRPGAVRPRVLPNEFGAFVRRTRSNVMASASGGLSRHQSPNSFGLPRADFPDISAPIVRPNSFGLSLAGSIFGAFVRPTRSNVMESASGGLSRHQSPNSFGLLRPDFPHGSVLIHSGCGRTFQTSESEFIRAAAGGCSRHQNPNSFGCLRNPASRPAANSAKGPSDREKLLPAQQRQTSAQR